MAEKVYSNMYLDSKSLVRHKILGGKWSVWQFDLPAPPRVTEELKSIVLGKIEFVPQSSKCFAKIY